MKIESAGLFSMPAEQYHSHPAVGHSGLVRIMRSPAHYKDVLTDPPDPTPAMRLGTAFHTALLEPDRFGQTFVVAPKFDRRTKEGKAQAEAWDTENAGKTALTPEYVLPLQSSVGLRLPWQSSGAYSLIGLGIFTLDKQTATGAAPGNRIGNHQPGPGVPTRYGEAFGLAKEV